MGYTVALTKSGQMTLPKALREFLGVEGAKTITIEKRKDEIVVKRRKSYEDFRAEMDKHISTKTRQILEEEKKNGGRPPIREIMKEIYESEEMRKRWKEKLGE